MINRQQRGTKHAVIRRASANNGLPYQYPWEAEEDEDYDDRWPPPVGSSAIRYIQPHGTTRYEYRPVVQTTTPPKKILPPQPPTKNTTGDIPATKSKRGHWHIHWSLFLGLGMLLMFFAWVGLTDLTSWWTTTQDNWTYTTQFRTYSVDMVVGHNNDSAAHPSHFIVQNDHRRIIIIEFPANDASKAVIYVAPTLIGPGQEKTPVTISFQDNTQTGRQDMILHVEDQQYLFTNNGTKFVLAPGQ